MIPFWKKTGKHSKPQSVQKRRQNTKPAVPRTAQQSIPMQRMFEDGTCRVKANYYNLTITQDDSFAFLFIPLCNTSILKLFHKPIRSPAMLQIFLRRSGLWNRWSRNADPSGRDRLQMSLLQNSAHCGKK